MSNRFTNIIARGYVPIPISTDTNPEEINTIKTLAETNQLNLTLKADQSDLEQTNQSLTDLTQAVSLKASKTDLNDLSLALGTKADQSYVLGEIARLTENAPEALNTLYELATEITKDQGQIEQILSALDVRLKVDSDQALTTTQQDQARLNINAEKVGVAKGLVDALTPAKIGAATTAQGSKADSAIQSGDLAPVALSGLFSSLSNQSKIFDVIYNAYTLGANIALAATDSLGQMLGKLQAQINQNKTDIASKEPTIAAGISGQYWDGTKTWKALPAGGGLTNLSEYFSNTGSNSTSQPAVGLTTQNRTETDVNIAIVAKGNGYFSLNSAAPSRGTGSVDLQMPSAVYNVRNMGGSYSLRAGSGNIISYASYAVALGSDNSVGGQGSAAIGMSNNVSSTSSFAVGANNSINTNYNYCVAMGAGGAPRQSNTFCFGIGAGYQTQIVGLKTSTTNATATSMYYTYVFNSLRHIKGHVIAKNSTNTEFAAWDFTAVMSCGNSTTSNVLIAPPTVTNVGATSGAVSWSISVAATTGSFVITVTGAASTTINWFATLYVQELY